MLTKMVCSQPMTTFVTCLACGHNWRVSRIVQNSPAFCAEKLSVACSSRDLLPRRNVYSILAQSRLHLPLQLISMPLCLYASMPPFRVGSSFCLFRDVSGKNLLITKLCRVSKAASVRNLQRLSQGGNFPQLSIAIDAIATFAI